LRNLPPLSCRFHQDWIEKLASSADALPPVAADFRELPGLVQGYHASNLAGMQPRPFCCGFPFLAQGTGARRRGSAYRLDVLECLWSLALAVLAIRAGLTDNHSLVG
jgi:hypothetical protein